MFADIDKASSQQKYLRKQHFSEFHFLHSFSSLFVGGYHESEPMNSQPPATAGKACIRAWDYRVYILHATLAERRRHEAISVEFGARMG